MALKPAHIGSLSALWARPIIQILSTCLPQVDDAVFARNFGKGEPWIEGKVSEVLGVRNYLIEVKDFGNILWKRHHDQLMPRFTGSYIAPKVSPLPTTYVPHVNEYSLPNEFVPHVNESPTNESNLHVNEEVSFPESVDGSAKIASPNVSNKSPS